MKDSDVVVIGFGFRCEEVTKQRATGIVIDLVRIKPFWASWLVGWFAGLSASQSLANEQTNKPEFH